MRINSAAIYIDVNRIISVNKSTLQVTEGGSAESYTISFSRAPRADVTLSITHTGRLLINGATTATLTIPAGGTSATVFDDDYAQVQFSFTNAAGSPSLTSTIPSGLTLNTKGSPASATGADGDSIGAYQFSGSQDLSLANSNGLASDNQARTICSFVNPDTYPASGFRSVVAYGENASASDPQGIGINSSGFAQYNYGLTNSIAGTVQVPLRTWSHICGVYDGSTAYVYVNGSLEAQVSALTLATVIGASIPFHIGRWVEVGSEFVGRIDEVRIYKRALNQNEIRQIGRQVQSGLVMHYDMLDAPTGAIRDLGTAAANGTASSVTQTTDCHGRTASAYTFGSSSSVTSAVLPLTTSTTYSVWIRPRVLQTTGTTHNIMGNSNGTDGATLALHNNSGTNRLVYQLRNAGSNFDAAFNHAMPLNSYTHLAVTLTDDARVYDRALSTAEIKILTGHRLRQTGSFANMRMLCMGETATCAGSPCADGGAVDSLPDSSNSGHNLVANSTRRPTFRSNAINSRPGISFLSSVPQYMNSSAYATGLNTTYTFFWVVTQNSSSLGGWIFSTGTSPCYTDTAWSHDGYSTSCNVGGIGGASLPATGPYLMTIKRTATNSQTPYVSGVTTGAVSS